MPEQDTLSLLRRFVAYDPITDDDMGNVFCFFCFEHQYGDYDNSPQHTQDCVWLEAKRYLAEIDEVARDNALRVIQSVTQQYLAKIYKEEE